MTISWFFFFLICRKVFFTLSTVCLAGFNLTYSILALKGWVHLRTNCSAQSILTISGQPWKEEYDLMLNKAWECFTQHALERMPRPYHEKRLPIWHTKKCVFLNRPRWTGSTTLEVFFSLFFYLIIFFFFLAFLVVRGLCLPTFSSSIWFIFIIIIFVFKTVIKDGLAWLILLALLSWLM